MVRAKSLPKKEISWYGYEVYPYEPRMHKRYDLTPKMENEILGRDIFLKHRVWRQMKTTQKNYARATARSQLVGHEIRKPRHAMHRPRIALHHF
jgi:hypothetical protein